MRRNFFKVYSQKGALIYTALIIMIIVFILAIVISEVVSMLRYQRRELLREEQILVVLDNTIQEGISYLQSIPYEDINRTNGIYDDLVEVQYPDGWVMIDKRCGFIASLISFSSTDAIWEIWCRCRFPDVEKMEKVKVRFSLNQL